jgi:hypothetical protein
MAVTHVVVFSWTDKTSDEDVAKIHAALQAFIDADEGLEGLVSWKGGSDLHLAENNADYGVSATFEDRTAYERYRDHPEHRRVITELIGPHIAQRTVLQFEH